MSYKTVEVELENGYVRPAGAECLPLKARALLTILSSADLEPVETEGPSICELTGELVGIGNRTHTDLSYNEAHM